MYPSPRTGRPEVHHVQQQLGPREIRKPAFWPASRRMARARRRGERVLAPISAYEISGTG
jgi:hypothetical protein